ncbi:MAG: hypothetical protein QM708_07205 [Propioniciclava sp.]|uniref:hypothetical protein n=1 Tax=Propioniciclava sp. TaxID=2038686 RepID=UPI0039E5A39A
MTAILKVQVVTDASDAARDLDKVASAGSRLDDGLRRAAVPAAAVGVGLLALAQDAASSASSLQESTGAVESVFKGQADAVKAYAAQAVDSVGLATSEYQEMASIVGSQLKNMGVPTAQLAGQTDDLISKGADLAATFGGPTSDAVAALGSLMRGEADPIERYGVSIKAADVEARKAAMGLNGLTGEADKAATAQAMLALLNEQTADTAGAFAREADNAAGAQQRARAAAEEASATLGTALLPAQTAANQAMAVAATFITENADAFLILIGVLGTLVGVVVGYNAIMTALPAIQAAVTAAQWLWNAALAANPVGLAIIGIAGLIAIIVLLVQNWNAVKQVALDCWRATVAAGQAAWGWLSQTFNQIEAAGAEFLQPAMDAIDRLMGLARRAADVVGGLLAGAKKVGADIGSFFSGASVGAQLTVSPADFTAAAGISAAPAFMRGSNSAATAVAPVIAITVNGALDPRAVAAQIRSILTSDARIRGVIDLTGSPL